MEILIPVMLIISIVPLILLMLILSVIIVIFQPKIKGYFGEQAVAGQLSALPRQYYKVLNDVMLRTSYGTTQIDHVVVSIYGIFVIETKNYKGWITGSEYGEQWTKNMYGKKYSFRNPLKQNYAHVKALEDRLNLTQDKFIPIVAFSGNCDIKVQTSKPVVYISQLNRVIQGYKDIKFSEAELWELVNKILQANIVEKEAKKQHVNQIKNQVRNNQAKVDSGMCPKCGGQLVMRKGQYGTFIGCSNYPKCRYTRN